MNTQKNLQDILQERLRQEVLKAQGRFKYTCADVEMLQGDRFLILCEEVGEVARAILNKEGLSTDKEHGELRKELIQVAAICLAWLDGLDKPNIY